MTGETNADAMSNEELVEVYGDLSTADLAKQINDDYSVILGSERANLPRALAIAPKLSVLRTRPWGQWKTKFPSYSLTISYETASVYLRIWEHWPEIKNLAAKKSVDPTLLTIDGARELWARRKDTDNEEEAETDDSPEEEEDNSDNGDGVVRRPASWAADHVLEELELEAGEMFEVLKQVYDRDYLLDLTERLAKHLGMTLMPLAQSQALMEAISGPATTTEMTQ